MGCLLYVVMYVHTNNQWWKKYHLLKKKYCMQNLT